MKQVQNKIKIQKITSSGHIYYIDKNGKDHITFFNNPFGKILKAFWDQLQKPLHPENEVSFFDYKGAEK